MFGFTGSFSVELNFVPLFLSTFYQISNKNMTSMASDCESNVSGFINSSDRNISIMYLSAIKGMESINQDLLLIANNMKRIVSQAGPLEGQLNALLRALPDPSLQLNMETE